MAARRDETGHRRRAAKEQLGSDFYQRQRRTRSLEPFSCGRDFMVASVVPVRIEALVRAEPVKAWQAPVAGDGSAAGSAAVRRAPPPPRRGRDALGTAGKMPALRSGFWHFSERPEARRTTTRPIR